MLRVQLFVVCCVIFFTKNYIYQLISWCSWYLVLNMVLCVCGSVSGSKNGYKTANNGRISNFKVSSKAFWCSALDFAIKSSTASMFGGKNRTKKLWKKTLKTCLKWPIMDRFQILRCLWKRLKKCFHLPFWNFQKSKITLKKDPKSFWKSHSMFSDTNLLYPEAKYNDNYFIINNA